MSDQSALQMAQETMIKCQKSIALLEAQYKSNQEIVAFNNAKILECNAQDQRNIDDFKNRCDDKHRKRDDWDRCRNDRERAHLDWRGEGEGGRCVVWEVAKNGWNCGDGKVGDDAYGGGCPPGWGKSRCKWSGESAREFARQDCGPEPNTDCGPKPQPVPCPLKQQDATQVAVNCCANVSSIVGSQVDKSIIDQQNSCLNDQKKTVLGPSQSQTQTSSSQTKNQQAQNQQTSGSNNGSGATIIIIIVIIVIICIIGFIYYNYYYRSSYRGFPPRLPYYPPPPPPRPYYTPQQVPIAIQPPPPPPPPRPYYIPQPPPQAVPISVPAQLLPPPQVAVPVPVQAPVSTQLPPGKYMKVSPNKVMKIG